MVSTDTKPTVHTRILHIHKNSQTNNRQRTDYFGMRRPDRKNFGICGQTPTAYCSIAEIVHQRYHCLHQFYRKQKVPNKHIASDNERHKPIHKYTASRGYTNCMLGIRRILSKQPSNPNYVYQTNVKAHSTRKLVQVQTRLQTNIFCSFAGPRWELRQPSHLPTFLW